jgi:ABC-2 type transport system permease protein
VRSPAALEQARSTRLPPACFAATLGQIGELLGLPDWVLDVSPYTHAPRMPLQDFHLCPAVVLSVVAAALLAVSWLRYRSRDIG